MLKKLMVIGFVILQSSNVNAETLNQALELAYSTNPSLESARKNLRAVDENAFAAISGWLPNISARYDRGKRDTAIGVITTDTTTENKDFTITQPLFRGGKTVSEMKQAKSIIMSARAELKNSEQEILLEAVTAYMDIVRDQEVLELSKNNVKVLESHLEVTKERFSLGEVTRTDVAQSEANLAKAVSERIASKGKLESSKSAYKKVVGIEARDVAIPENPIVIKASLESMIDLALNNNPQVEVYRHNLAASERAVTAQKAGLLPQVDLTASKQKQKGALFSSSDIESESFGVQVSVPLYNSGITYSRVRKAKHEADKIRYSLVDQENIARDAVISAYNDYQVANSSIESNLSTVSAFGVALEGTEQEAKVGARTTLDVLDAEQDLFEAKANLVRSRRDEIVSSYTLLAQIGRLNSKELGLDVKIYDPKKNYNKVKHKIIGF